MRRLLLVIAQRRMLPVAPQVQTVVEPVIRDEDDVRLEPLYHVLIHNDDVTPYDYVVRILQRIFMLSEEIADHVAWTAHHEGVAIVVIRPRSEALKLIQVARTQARLDGYPLFFSMELAD
jgi:ATP-dependent Clp protease adaptor protein ClpS